MDTKRTQRSDQFAMSKSSVITPVMESRFKSGDNANVWVVISTGPNRCADELRHRESENIPEEADYECIQDTDQEQPTFQLESQCGMSEHHILILQRKWKNITSNVFSYKYTWESHISKILSKLVRHENSRERNKLSSSLEIEKSETQIHVPKGWKP